MIKMLRMRKRQKVRFNFNFYLPKSSLIGNQLYQSFSLFEEKQKKFNVIEYFNIK